MRAGPAPPAPPSVHKEPTVSVLHGDRRVDEYAWLRDRSRPEVLAHLEAENAYTRAVLAHTEDLQRELYEEFLARIVQTDATVPVPFGGHWYYRRTVEGLQYAIHCRRTGSLDAPEQVLLDENQLAEGYPYFALGNFAVSPDHRLLAYAVDHEGDEAYTLRVRDLETGEDLPDRIPNTSYGVAWAADNRTLFYTVLDDAKRPWQVWRHRLGEDPRSDHLVHQEDDPRFHAHVGLTRSQAFVVLALSSMVTSEVRLLRADDPGGTFQVVEPRRHGVEYSVDHSGDRLFLLTNDEAENFRLVEAPLADPSRRSWRELVPHRDDVYLQAVQAFRDHLLLHERAGGLERLRVLRLRDGAHHVVEQPEPVHSVRPHANPEFDTRRVLFRYTSLVTPVQDVEYDLETRSRVVRKQQPVRGYDPGAYETARLWATAPDGVRIPISVVHRRGIRRDGRAPCLLYAYGAYGHSTDPAFSPFRVSLLDRGFVYAIAHVRGGGELGRRWWEQGKLARKPTTFTDCIACAEELVAAGYTAPGRLVIRGRSAGGALVGAVLNLRPDLFRAAVAEVPFVDVLNTMLDPSLPLTAIEWEEWGDPREPDGYRAIRSWSPYDNVRPQPYPAVLATAGLHDPRVAYWEPAKWVARLREATTSSRPVLLKTELGAGHMGPSGRYEAWREEAFVLAFILDQAGTGSIPSF